VQRYLHPEVFVETFPEASAMDAVKSLQYSRSVVKWLVDRGEHNLKINYPLHNNSMVFDVGGYHGTYSDRIRERYDPYIHIFEPHPEFCKIIEEKFCHDSKIVIHKYGLSDSESVAFLSNQDQSSSIFSKTKDNFEVRMRDIKQVLEELQINQIDLIKMNIEGGEYPLLRRMIDTGVINYFNYIMVQFHTIYPNAHFYRREIRKSLSHSHRPMWDYPFVWESWERRDL
jgi:FkbM family methyltransferase